MEKSDTAVKLTSMLATYYWLSKDKNHAYDILEDFVKTLLAQYEKNDDDDDDDENDWEYLDA